MHLEKIRENQESRFDRYVIGTLIIVFAFFVAQNIDIQIFDKLRLNKKWYIAPLISSTSASIIDTFLFFSIAFYMTGIPWLTLE